MSLCYHLRMQGCGLQYGRGTNGRGSRHYQALLSASEALSRALDALNINLPGDLVSQDIRQAMYHLGEISTDDLLGNIFANFCIGK
ncbi:MAG: hypothetical protein IKV83_09655 [Muribaculaceae bacterium]|nr:hypothetical protein [Muribaculaceae bacterium]